MKKAKPFKAEHIHGYINSLERNLEALVLDRPGTEEAIAFAIFVYDRILKLDDGLWLAMCGWHGVVKPLMVKGIKFDAERPLPGLRRLTKVYAMAAQYLRRVKDAHNQGN